MNDSDVGTNMILGFLTFQISVPHDDYRDLLINIKIDLVGIVTYKILPDDDENLVIIFCHCWNR